jgi:branched-chain amino acid transport system ATP-binding protein
MTTPLLAVSDLDVHIGESHILHGLDFEVHEGQVTALLGRNGVGKTTTLKGLLGLVRRSGSIRYDGTELTGLATHEIVRQRIAYVPEDREVFSELTVAENLRLAERPGSESRYDLVHELFPRLAERRDQPAGTMSGGEQQMVALGRALLNDNRLLLVDEPTKGLAPNLVTEVADVLERIRDLTTSLLVEQNLGVVRRIADRAIVLDHGEVVYSGGVDELLDDTSRTKELLGVGSGRATDDGTRP